METTIMVVLIFLGSGHIVNSEKHSLHYIYTALSRPVNRPGIHEFTAMGLLDGKIIDYFDSDNQEKVPKQRWMKTKLEENYWEKGTQSRKSKQQWFKVNINILKERFHQNDTDLHVLQWMHGCEIDTTNPSKEELSHGIDMYSYDGANFLSFDDKNENWVAPVHEAYQTKTKWDHIQVLKDYTKVYLKNECVDWLEKFLTYQKEEEAPDPPDVFVLSRGANVQTNVVLTCMATGFSSMNTIIRIKRDGRLLTKDDGVQTSGLRPNEDGTFQQRDHVEIPKNDKSNYTCEVVHESSGLHMVKVWDKFEDKSTVPIAAVLAGLGILVFGIGIGLFFFIRKFLGERNGNAPKGIANGPFHIVVPCEGLAQINGRPDVQAAPDAAAEPLLVNDRKGSVPSLDSGVSSDGSHDPSWKEKQSDQESQ